MKGSMLPYIAAPWILWEMNRHESHKHRKPCDSSKVRQKIKAKRVSENENHFSKAVMGLGGWAIPGCVIRRIYILYKLYMARDGRSQ